MFSCSCNSHPWNCLNSNLFKSQSVLHVVSLHVMTKHCQFLQFSHMTVCQSVQIQMVLVRQNENSCLTKPFTFQSHNIGISFSSKDFDFQIGFLSSFQPFLRPTIHPLLCSTLRRDGAFIPEPCSPPKASSIPSSTSTHLSWL